MSASVTFFEETSFFSSSTQDVNFVQLVLPVLLEPFVYPTLDIVQMSPHNSNSSHQPN